MDICREVEPPEVVFPDGVRVACHLYPAGLRRRPGRRAEPAGRRNERSGRTGGRLDAGVIGPSATACTGMTELLRLEGLEVHFPIRGGLVDTLARRPVGVVRAVDGIDLTIERGEVLGLVGESGSGKTTTGRVIVKLTRQTAGKIVFDGRDVTDLWGDEPAARPTDAGSRSSSRTPTRR